MGVMLSYFRKKKSTIEILEKLDQDIKKLEQFRRKNQERQKRFIAKLILYSIVLYVVGALVFYFYYLPERWKERLLHSIPLLLFPLVIWLVKKGLHWYFVKRIAENDLELGDLREKKKQILEDVMEKETYKKAKEILEKFDPARFKELEPPKPEMKATPGTELRQRQVMQRSPPGTQPRFPPTPRSMIITPMRAPMSSVRPGMTPFAPRSSGRGIQPRNIEPSFINGTPQGPPLPRPILPRERGPMDRVLEYLVGDGPQNRYALICRECYSHNGMALKEEFEYIAYRCCYCHIFNAPRKRRPFAPRLEPPAPVPRIQTDSPDEEEEDSGDDDDEEGSGEGNDNENGVSEETGSGDSGNQAESNGNQGESNGNQRESNGNQAESSGDMATGNQGQEVEESMEVEEGSEVKGEGQGQAQTGEEGEQRGSITQD